MNRWDKPGGEKHGMVEVVKMLPHISKLEYLDNDIGTGHHDGFVCRGINEIFA